MSATGGAGFENRDTQLAIDLAEYREPLKRIVEEFKPEDYIDLCKTVVSLPPKERFTESHKRYVAFFTDLAYREESEPEPSDKIAQLLEEYASDPLSRRVYVEIDKLWDLVKGMVLRQVRVDREHDWQYLILGVYLDKANQAFVEVDRHAGEPDVLEKLLSVFAALSSRMILIVLGEQSELTEEMVRDVPRADFYLQKAIGGEPAVDPEEQSFEHIRREVFKEGAILAYQKADISVGRGAELANLPMKEFEEALAAAGVKPKYGPETVDELRSGTGLSKMDQ